MTVPTANGGAVWSDRLPRSISYPLRDGSTVNLQVAKNDFSNPARTPFAPQVCIGKASRVRPQADARPE